MIMVNKRGHLYGSRTSFLYGIGEKDYTCTFISIEGKWQGNDWGNFFTSFHKLFGVGRDECIGLEWKELKVWIRMKGFA